ncbi:MAG TPA: penicillin-binding protein 2 [Candidatus Saccharicenans sp.]|nr:penicillin-binding protein 2 [Candidatus Saccharicenans sp.]
MAKIYEDLSQLIKRSRLTLIIFSLLLFLILAFYWKIQILDHQKYWKMAEANRLRSLPLPAPRGLIYDRQRIILADNQPSFKVSLLQESIKNDSQTIERVSQLLNLKTEELKARIDRYRWLQTYGPVIIKDNLKLEEVALIEARREEFPELQLQVEPRRYYPFETTAAHVLGYLQEVSPEEMKGNPHKKWRGGEMIGKAAVEKQYDDYLTGKDGQLLETVDSLGRSLGEVNRIEPIKGRDLVLSIDLDLQKKAEGLLEGKEGAIIVLDSGSGECLAWVSSPSYDPNRFITRFSPEEWLSIINDPARPLENRVIRGQYSPGSIFKVVTALTSLETGLITDRTAFFCSGSINLYGKDFACWFKPGHGLLSLPEALKNSCNIYFYQLGRRLNVDTIARYARALGLGQITGVDMPGEKEGLIPSSDWKKKTQGEAWYPGETISVAIGQGPVLVTPLQVAALTACLANRGIRVKPRVTRLEGKMGPVKDKTGINPETFEKIIEGMWRSVNDGGTGHGAYQPGFDICGKTGSTQVISREKAERMIKRGEEPAKTHSWFTGFAPRYQPQVVVTVLVEFGGMGGQTAAPIAGEMFKLYREKYVRQTNLQGN